ncbi:MAG: type II toxin-antitoxin system RelE/ParE family toxin [Leptospirales bacterium]
MKDVVFDPNARKAIKGFPKDAKMEFGKLLVVLQEGKVLGMPNSRPMPSVAKGASELRIKDRSGNFRIFYYTKVKDELLIFHAFMKKTSNTPIREIEVAKKRLAKMLNSEQ